MLIYRRSGKPFLITLEPQPDRFHLLKLGVACIVVAGFLLYVIFAVRGAR